jgi:hypothetical protein
MFSRRLLVKAENLLFFRAGVVGLFVESFFLVGNTTTNALALVFLRDTFI